MKKYSIEDDFIKNLEDKSFFSRIPIKIKMPA